MIEGAGTLAAASYAGSQAVQGETEPVRGSGDDVAKGKVSPPNRAENMFEESNSQRQAAPEAGAEAGAGRIINLLG